MALFQVTVRGRSPLSIQLTAPSDASIRVAGWSVLGDGAFGKTSRPVLYRPSSPGVARASEETAIVSCLSQDGKSSPAAAVATAFSVPPSTPETFQSTAALPYRSSERFHPGIEVLPKESIVLYAATDFEAGSLENTEALPNHSWSGTLTWEEL